MSQRRTSWNTSRIRFTTKFKTTNVSLGEEVATVPSKSVGLICRRKHFDAHTEKISDGLIARHQDGRRAGNVSISRQTSPPTSSQKVWFTSSPVGCVQLHRCVVPVCIRHYFVSHTSVTQNCQRYTTVCCKSRPAPSHVTHTVCSHLFVVTCCSLTYGNVNKALHGLCACFQG